MAEPLLVYGGTFDPVHEGHVAVARAAADALDIGRVLLVPAGDPPHRGAPHAAGALRAAMLRRAFADDPRFVVDERELHRGRPSYTVDTLRSLRSELGPLVPLVLLLGADAFLGLPGWHRWTELSRLAHFAVVARPGVRLDPLGGDWPPGVAPPAADPAVLRAQPAGGCVIVTSRPSEASSTAIRAALAAGDPRPAGLPERVAQLLEEAGNPYPRCR
jgi:nicotinate-nucleotide adenylyltransferase